MFKLSRLTSRTFVFDWVALVMPPLVKIKMELKSRDLLNSLRQLSQKSNRLPSYLVNKACFSIAIRTEKTMPVVSPSKISADMDSITRQQMTKGTKKNPSRPKKGKNKTWNDIVEGGAATRIVLARMWPGSKFNIRTGNVFAINRAAFSPGGGQAAFLRKVHETATRMVGARRSSSGFFKVCASVVKFVFAKTKSPLNSTPSGLAEGVEAVAGSGKVSKNIGRLAGGIRATGTSPSARASFWVSATEPDTKGTPGGAIFRVAQPVWQRSIDAEAQSIKQYASTLYSQAARESGLKVV